MLEMNAGEVWTLAESYLGLRHGPMSAIRPDTLVVAFLSSDPLVRAYERDLLARARPQGPRRGPRGRGRGRSRRASSPRPTRSLARLRAPARRARTRT